MKSDMKFRCDYCDTPCFLTMTGIGEDDGEYVQPICCPYDGSKNKDYWKVVKV